MISDLNGTYFISNKDSAQSNANTDHNSHIIVNKTDTTDYGLTVNSKFCTFNFTSTNSVTCICVFKLIIIDA